MKKLALALLVLVGCNGGGEEPRDVLVNTAWVTTVPTTTCAAGFGFYDGGTYARLLLCTLTDGTQGLEVNSGDYVVDGNRVTTFMRKATCPAGIYLSLSPSFNFAINGNTLTMGGTSELVTYDRATSMPGSGGTAYTYGCYESDGYFHPLPLADL